MLALVGTDTVNLDPGIYDLRLTAQMKAATFSAEPLDRGAGRIAWMGPGPHLVAVVSISNAPGIPFHMHLPSGLMLKCILVSFGKERTVTQECAMSIRWVLPCTRKCDRT